MAKLPLTTQKTSTSSSINAKLDLRSPAFTRLRKGTSVERIRVVILVLLDCGLLSLAWLIAGAYGTPITSSWSLQHPLSLLPILAIEIGLIAAQGLYQSGEKRRDYFGLIKTLTFAHFVLLLVAFLYQPTGTFVSRSTFILSWLLSVAFTCTGRLFVDVTLGQLRQRGAVQTPAFVICHPEDTQKAVKIIEQENCYKVIGVADVEASDRRGWEAILEDINRLGVIQVFICSWYSQKNRMFLYWSFRNAGIRLHILPISLEAPIEAFWQKPQLSLVGGLPSISFHPPLITGSDFYIKRCFDFTFSALFLLLTSPIYLCLALLIKLDSPGPIFYKQTRIGLHGEPFKAWKFRTMVRNADQLQKELEARNEMKDGVLFKM
ncbi:MAG TPA: sugar transferase, partial [Candidatus Caenarcaniphilales bacterium]